MFQWRLVRRKILVTGMLTLFTLASCSSASPTPVTPTPTFSKFLPPTWTPTTSPTIKISTPFSETPSPTVSPAIHPAAIKPGIFAVYRKGDMLYATSSSSEEETLLGVYSQEGMVTVSSNGQILTYMEDGFLHNQNIFSLQKEILSMPRHSIERNLWEGEWSPDDRYLIYAIDQVLLDSQPSQIEEFPSIYVYNHSENDFSQVTNWNTVESSPIWSPDNQWIAFLSDHEKVLSGAQGNYVGASDLFVLSTQCLAQMESCKDSFFKQITHTETDGDVISPDWQPNNSKIAFIYIDSQSGNRDIYLVDLDGRLENLTKSGVIEDAFSWSPDGNKLVYKGNIPGYGTDLYILNLENHTTTNITYSPTLEEGNPAWSPDGLEIAFTRDVNDINSGIATYSLDTQESKLLPGTGQGSFLFWLTVFPQIDEDIHLVVSPSGENLNIRAEPSMESAILTTLQNGDPITIQNRPVASDGYIWWKVKHKDQEGWAVQIYDWYLPVP